MKRSNYVFDRRKEVLDVLVDDDQCLEFLSSLEKFSSGFDFGYDVPKSGLRYYSNNKTFHGPDAVLLASIIKKYGPKKIIEVGSGFTTALMLDVNQEFLSGAIEFTCIDPSCARLRALIKSDDSVIIIEDEVQDVSTEKFLDLAENDILFIDGSHKCATDSDLNFIMFEVLPRIAPGVLIHFHDVFWPFEYPEDWVLKRNWNFNEAYVLRAFLAYNSEFSLLLSSSYAYLYHEEELRKRLKLPDDYKFDYNILASLWMVRK